MSGSFVVSVVGELSDARRVPQTTRGTLLMQTCRAQRSHVGAPHRLRFVACFAFRGLRVVAVLNEPVVKRLQADAENLCRARLHAAALLERGKNQLPVGFGERRAERNRDRGTRRRFAMEICNGTTAVASESALDMMWARCT